MKNHPDEFRRSCALGISARVLCLRHCHLYQIQEVSKP